MRRIVFYGLLTLLLFLCGCMYLSDLVSLTPDRQSASSAGDDQGAGTVKTPLFEKPVLTADDAAEEDKPVEFRLNLAKKYLEEEQYEKIPPVLDEIARFEPGNRDALDIGNETYYQLGLSFYKARQYVAARDALQRIPPDYKDTKSLLASTGQAIDRLIDIHYKRGVKYFINEELKNAIWEWEKVLALDPDHLQAAEDIENARQLLQRVETINRQPNDSESP